MIARCAWAGSDSLMQEYHDREWGTPLHDERRLFEFLILEGAQAGLSWATILKKREHYRRAFSGFDPAKVARFTPAKVDRLLQDDGARVHPLVHEEDGDTGHLHAVGERVGHTVHPREGRQE